MKAYFVTLSDQDCQGYSTCLTVEGKNTKECILEGIKAFDKEMISL
jgi:hypothetical protein